MKSLAIRRAGLLWLLPLMVSAAEGLPTGAPALLPDSPASYWEQSLSGGPGKDGIPAVDAPQFVSAADADAWLEVGDRIIGVYRDGQAKAYPQSIVVWHEIVNDTVGGHNLSITYCPLTGTALGFARGDTSLGVSGRLVNSNLIMYDRASDSYWPQMLAAAAHGPRQGQGLQPVRVFWTTWAQWRARHPTTTVLSQDTGYFRNYDRDPYGGYNPTQGYYTANSGRLFPVAHESDRYPSKQEIFGFRSDGEAVAVDRAALAANAVMRHRGEHADFLILHDPGLDTAWVYRGERGSLPADAALRDLEFRPAGPRSDALAGLQPVIGFESMWFAWYAFYPDTAVLDDRAF